MIDGHMISERANLLVHRQIAAMVDGSPDILDKASRRIDETVTVTGGTSGERMWQIIFQRPWNQVRKQMLDDGPDGRLLRSNSPFPFIVGPLDITERRRLWQQAKSELLAETTSYAPSKLSPSISTPSR